MKEIFFTDRNVKINNRKFNGQLVPEWLLGPAFSDAWDVCFGKKIGCGGRSLGRAFHAIFIGKLGEHLLCDVFRSKGYKCYRPEYFINNEGGDNGDLILKRGSEKLLISVKTCMDYGKYLVEPVTHFNDDGVYIHNGKNLIFDRHYLVRVNQYLVHLNFNVSKEQLWKSIKSLDWKYEITGFITHEDFKEAMKRKLIIHKGELNFSSDSYYVQSGDLRQMSRTIFMSTNKTVERIFNSQT